MNKLEAYRACGLKNKLGSMNGYLGQQFFVSHVAVFGLFPRLRLLKIIFVVSVAVP